MTSTPHRIVEAHELPLMQAASVLTDAMTALNSDYRNAGQIRARTARILARRQAVAEAAAREAVARERDALCRDAILRAAIARRVRAA